MTREERDLLTAAMECCTALLGGNVDRARESAAAAYALDLAQRKASKDRRSAAGKAAAERRWTDANGMRSSCVTDAMALPRHKDRICDGIGNALATHEQGIGNASESHGGVTRNSSSDLVLLPDPSSPKSAILSMPSDPKNTKPARLRSARAHADPGLSAAAWTAYATAYRRRYGTDPVRNAKVNGQLAQLVQRLSAEDLTGTIAHYVQSNNARYVASRHAVGPLLHDAEGLRTDWVRGQQTTSSAAQRLDRTADRMNGYEAAKAQLRAEAEEEARNHGR